MDNLQAAARQGKIEFCHRQIVLRCAGDHWPSRLQRAAAFAAKLFELPPSQEFQDTLTTRFRFIAEVALHRLRPFDFGCTAPRCEEVVVHHRGGDGHPHGLPELSIQSSSTITRKTGAGMQ